MNLAHRENGWQYALQSGLLMLVLLVTTQQAMGQANRVQAGSTVATSNSRRPADELDLRRWLENMVWYHRFSTEEISDATGLSIDEVNRAIQRLKISASTRPVRPAGANLMVLPYPGGRHPRIGFLEGAIRPQRETKVSVFTPWDPLSYVVVDVPEAIWSNLGLTYLAHTHVETIWERQQVTLPPLEWQAAADGTLSVTRTLPNGIEFGTRVLPHPNHVEMEMWLKNGTAELLQDLRVQNCVMLKSATGFADQTNENKRFTGPFAACHDASGSRWIITAWTPIHRAWGNERCPCLHADPQFPDCAPGQTERLRGWLSFFIGTDIETELARISKQLNESTDAR